MGGWLNFLLCSAQVITAGEQLQLTPSLLEFFAAAPGCELHNHYGPSETHVCTWHALRGSPSTWTVRDGPLPPIGKPVGGARVYIVDTTSLQLQACTALTVYYPLLTANYSLPTTHYPLPTTHYPLSTIPYPLLTTPYPLHLTHYPLPTTHYPLSTIYSSPLTTHFSLLRTQYPLLTTHYSLPPTPLPHYPTTPLPTTHYPLPTTLLPVHSS